MYMGKVYQIEIKGKEALQLYSKERSDKKLNGFTNYIDVLGKVQEDTFTKEVSIDDVDLAYYLKVNALYKGKEFETCGIGSFCLEDNSLVLSSRETKDMEDYGFEKQEQFVFDKEVSLDDLDALIEIKTPILKFRRMPEKRKLILKSMIKEYILSFRGRKCI